MITEYEVLIAVATRRTQTAAGVWLMPEAVSHEIAMAYGLGKRTLIFLESGVAPLGFVTGFGTFGSFDRGALIEQNGDHASALSTLRRNIERSAHSSTIEAMGRLDRRYVVLTRGQRVASEFIWSTEISREIEFLTDNAQAIRVDYSVDAPDPDAVSSGALLEFGLRIDEHGTDFDLQRSIEATATDVRISLEPARKYPAGALLTINFSCSSPRFIARNSIEAEASRLTATINGTEYRCVDVNLVGSVTTHFVKRLELSRGLRVGYYDIVPIAGGYGTTGSYLVPDADELSRCSVTREEIGDMMVFELRIENPRRFVAYGFAWNAAAAV